MTSERRKRGARSRRRGRLAESLAVLFLRLKGYRILERKLIKSYNGKQPDEYRVTRWLPMEVSLVDIPADATVGIGRSAEDRPRYRVVELPESGEQLEKTMPDEQRVAGVPTTPVTPSADNVVAIDQARAAGAQRFGLVSALGADAGSAVFYNRCKGEVEAALRGLGFARLVIARPSLLLGDRSPLGQPERPGERWAQRLTPLIGPLVPARWRPIEAGTVAAALLAATLDDPAPATRVLESDALQRLGRAAAQR